MSIEGIGEYHLYEIVRKMLNKSSYLPPGTVLKIDFVIAPYFIFLEVEDTIAEIYSGTKQLLSIIEISRVYNASLILLSPFPRKLSSCFAPIIYFFRRCEERRISRKEIWLLFALSDSVIRIKLRKDEKIPIKTTFNEIFLELNEINPDELLQKLMKLNLRKT